MQALRDIRTVQAENPTDVSTRFEKFVADSTEDLLVTQSFAKVGRPKGGRLIDDRIKVIKPPSFKCARALIHIGLNESELRFDHNAFKQWCFRNGLSHTAVLGDMEKSWGIKQARLVLAVGTEWTSGGNVFYYRLPLTAPELKHHLDWGTSTPADATNVVPFPAAE